MTNRFLQIFFVICSTTSCWSQNIVNTEKLFRTDTDGLAFASELNGNLLSGNANMFLLEYSLNTAFKKNKQSVMLLSGGEYIEENNELVSNSIFGQFRYAYQIWEKGSFFGYYQLQRNEILLLNRRQLFGIGYKQTLIKSEKDSLRSFKLDMSVSVMQEEEILNSKLIDSLDNNYTNYTRSSVSTIINWSPKNTISIINTTYFQPYLGNLSDFRILNELNFIMEINNWLSFSTDIEFRFDSDPPSVLVDQDLNAKFGFLISL